MYTREIQPPRETLIENGMPVSGTWDKAFAHVNLWDIRHPYSWPLPRWLKDYRIKEWEKFNIQDEQFFLEALFGNFKLFQFAQVLLYNKDTGKKYVYKKLLWGNKWRMPRNLNHGSVESHSPRFFFRIHTWLDADTIKLDIDIEATKKQPSLTVHLAYSMKEHDVTPVAAALNFTERRNMYTFKALTVVRGDLVLENRHISLNPERCTGLFCDYKGFFPYRMRGVFCGSMGFDGDGRRYGFHIAENQAKETRKNNENALWVDGHCTPLPPVRITMPNGPESDWVIQDIDGMVDLVFTPKEINRFVANFLIARGDFFAPIGYYNGMLINARGEQIQVHNQWGIGEKLYLRV